MENQMFSKSLLPLIAKHDSQLYGGTSEWPENAYGRDSSNHYDRRETLRPLPSEDLYLEDAANTDAGPTAYVVKFSAAGEIQINSVPNE